MFCKYCGASIEGDSSVCPSCSRKGGRVDSGVGFWDMFSAPEDSSVAAPFVEKAAKSTAESAFESPDRARMDALELRLEMLENKPEPKLPKSSPLPFLLCMILCIALCAASFLIISSRTNKELRNLESIVLQLQDRVMAAERAMEEYHTAGYGPASPTIEAPAQAPVTELPAPIPEESTIEVMNVPSDETRMQFSCF